MRSRRKMGPESASHARTMKHAAVAKKSLHQLLRTLPGGEARFKTFAETAVV